MLVSNHENLVYTHKKQVEEMVIDTEKYPREAVIECLMRFFNAPSVKNLSLDRKFNFLRQKGLKENGALLSLLDTYLSVLFVLWQTLLLSMRHPC
jgi:hypothetical protein